MKPKGPLILDNGKCIWWLHGQCDEPHLPDKQMCAYHQAAIVRRRCLRAIDRKRREVQDATTSDGR